MFYTTAGMKIEIGGTHAMQSADFSEADFSGESWQEITGHESLGQIGDVSEEVTLDLIGDNRMKRIKGTRNTPPVELIMASNYDDAGQQALIAAEKTDDNYAFQFTFNDAPAGGTPSKRIFIAAVAGVTEQYDTANSVIRLNATLWVNSNTVRVDAASV